jgi:hypothetical protein
MDIEAYMQFVFWFLGITAVLITAALVFGD